MELDGIIAAAPTPLDNGEELGRFLDDMLAADDLPAAERPAFCAGWMTGMIHAMAFTGPGDIVRELAAREAAWSAKGWL